MKALRFYFILGALQGIRVLNGATSIIPDCDEVFNYWEPIHYLTNGFGLQTWEYSPVYAIRSWAYIALQAVYFKLTTVIILLTTRHSTSSASLLLLIRSYFGVVSGFAEISLYISLNRSKLFGSNIALAYIVISALSSGMSHASVSSLPSSFAMVLFTISLKYLVDYLSAETNRARATAISSGLFAVVVGGVLGWPFVLALAPAWALHYLYISFKAVSSAVEKKKQVKGGKPIDEKKGIDETQALDLTPYRAFFNSTLSVIKASVILIVIIVGIDAVAYRKIEFVPLNIVLYNVIHASADSGPNIFGTEPWYYYLANLALNFNIALPLALAAPIALPFSSIKKKRQALLLVLPFFLWLAIFTAQPHKEERFMYIVYGSLAVNAAVSIDAIMQVGSRVLPRWPWIGKIVVAAVLMVYAALSVMRTSALISYYGAPMKVYDKVHELTPQVPTADGGKYSNVCVGREWYRFPSSYFLRDDQRLKFIASGFDGLLPGEFAEGGDGLHDWRFGTHVVPSGMNNRNEADPSKLVPVSACDYIVDTDLDTAPGETRFTRDEEHWKKVVCEPFLDAGASRGIARQLKIPTALHKFTKSELVWTEYCLLERVN
ncbi:similar to Saccharomyces cerevisiae YNL219C ALG9 Mannosyltransferase [Geotrichum candidum]|uniref:Mannosyltransferase n=1 Tax=Geotrichum candidum TaxID=1173061 RepID=A0A0J9XCD2_GEOCN|nr:similar to Saccharomyces cerevisiae YNL219C ALG9 Mannosyltransferase [Geotrichum candidum]